MRSLGEHHHSCRCQSLLGLSANLGTETCEKAEQRHVPGASGLQGAAFNIFGGDAVRSHRFPYMQPWRVSPEPTKTQEDVPEAQTLKSGGAQCKC